METGGAARFETDGVVGYLHHPAEACGNRRGLVLAHGAGSDCRAPLLVAAAEAFAATGFTVLRCDLPYRQRRRSGPPGPGDAAQDRDGLRRAVAALREFAPLGVSLGGHSYGGRQASMLAAEEPEMAPGLLLMSYPLHPPRQPERPRTAHLARLRTPALFIHGDRDLFGTVEEMRAALQLIPARTALEILPGGHDLGRFSQEARRLAAVFAELVGL